MGDDQPKVDDDDPLIDPTLKEKKSNKPASPQPVNPAGESRRENESASNQDTDGQRKRAEEGL